MATEKKAHWEIGDYYDIGDVCSNCDYDSCLVNPKIPVCPCCGAEMVIDVDGGADNGL